ncbi:MobH family relaxase [Brenneria tiliae]|uniref:MobH family relaxase n=1 Tax=Brenneria tiliae TaxID=2914984 RepID=UPI002014F9E0|nr:MobH family relaxase [Brenneria tiliae]MCL2897200.1 TraI domain-containing protein [Brenneria tiliae]MCL2904853.1 TraI domain-containing protein [Brenneria tiliae]
MKTGIHAKLKWLTGKKPISEPATAPVSQEITTGWLYPQKAEALLVTPLRRQLMKIIWQRTSLPVALFKELYQRPVAHFAELVQQFPASEYHHHSHPGGLLDHTLEVMAFTAKLRQRHLLPAGAAPEDQAREAEVWTAGILYAALLHDVGKIVTDIEVMTDDNQRWLPWMGPLTKPYRLRYQKNRDHRLHPMIGSLMALQILPVSALNWLAQYRELNESFLYCISGHYDNAGVLGELVQEADRASVAQFMGGNASQTLTRPASSLPEQLISALRELVRAEFKLSNPSSGSDGWLTDDALWLISKTTADRARAWLLQQGVTSVPDSNVRLFDEMQAHGLIVPTPEGKAVWSCTVTADSGWTPGRPLTLLRLAPSLIWSNAEERPAPFTGKVIPGSTATTSPEKKDADSQSAPDITTPENELSELAFSLFALPEQETDKYILPESTDIVDELPEVQPGQVEAETGGRENVSLQPETPRPVAVPEADQVKDAGFIDWLKEGIRTHKIAVNDTLARVHMVEGKAFLVSPEIFKLYVRTTTGATGDEWKQVQKAFQKLKLHQRGNDGINIFVCEVQGPRKTRRVKGYLLNRPEDIFDEAVPEDNPYLSVVRTIQSSE